MAQKRPVGVVLLAVLHLGIGGLASALLAVYFGVQIPTQGLHLLGLLMLMLVFALGPGLGIGLLFKRAWAWYTATVVYLLVAALGGLGLFRGGVGLVSSIAPDVASIRDLMPGETAVQTLGVVVLLLYFIVSCVAFGLLFTNSILAYFGRSPRERRWLLPAELVGLVLIALAVGFWVAREERAAAAATEASANLPILHQIGERGTAAGRDVEFLLDRLDNGTDEERLTAAWALGACGTTEAIDPLTRIARKDDDYNVRINAVAALAQLGGAEIGPILVELLDDPDEQVRESALRGLADKSFRALAPEIGRLLDDDSAQIRSMAVDVLGRMADPVSIPALSGATNDADPDIRSRAAHALGKLRDPSAADALLAILDDSSWEVRANAAQALGMIGARDARAALSRATEDPNTYVRDAARTALERLR